MKASSIPSKFPQPWGTNATTQFIRSIPNITTDPTAASYNLGFPPATGTPVAAGGTPPDIRDENGILQIVTAWLQWVNAGGPVAYDSSFQTTIGGYPNGALVQSATTQGLWWLSTADNNTTNPDAGGANWLPIQGAAPAEQYLLQYISASQIQLTPWDGGQLWINGVNYQIPANLRLSATGLGAGTVYFIYAYMSGSPLIMTLEASATGYAMASNGVPQKVGDASRTLVGIVRMNASAQFQYGNGYLGIASWANQEQMLSTVGITGGDISTSSNTPVDVDVALDTYVVKFAKQTIVIRASGQHTNNTAGSTVNTWVYIDGAQGSAVSQWIPPSGNQPMTFYCEGTVLPGADGAHLVQLFGSASANFAVWKNNAVTMNVEVN